MTMTATVGDFEVLALNDASGLFFEPATTAFPEATPDDWARARHVDPAAFGPDGAWWLDFRCHAVRRPDGRYVLVDTGVGPAPSWAPAPGCLPARLAAAGIDHADVDLVVLTHLHEDHYGWSVSPTGVPTFPNARYVVQRTEVAALTETVRDDVVEPLRRTGQLSEVDGRVTLSAHRDVRLTAEPTPGHTPGHQSVLLTGRSRRILITGDVLVHAVQLVSPEVAYKYEANPELARQTRETVLSQAERTVLATAHLTRPFVPVTRRAQARQDPERPKRDVRQSEWRP